MPELTPESDSHGAPVKLDPALFESSVPTVAPADFAACIDAHGLYHSQHFVLRLSPVNHALVKSLGNHGFVVAGDAPPAALQAYSTFVHETVHWWQHKGSTAGLVRSLCYPAQTHFSLAYLRELGAMPNVSKPLVEWGYELESAGKTALDREAHILNTVVNNFKDFNFFLGITYAPNLLIEADRDTYFECAAHCFHIAYAGVVQTLRDTVDRSGITFADPATWSQPFQACANARKEGHFYGSPIRVAPVGVLHILEGQARFIQMQFLSGMRKGGLSFNDANAAGMLNGVYGDAFRSFLELTQSAEPRTMDDPLVALFLLTCDLALNPSPGLLAPIEDFEHFHLDVDPGIRFADLCLAIADNLAVKSMITTLSRDDYVAVANILCDACSYERPMDALTRVASWDASNPEVAAVLAEHVRFKFQPTNLPLRLLLAEFVLFAKDKVARPEFFCWAGAWMTGGRPGTAELDLWLRHAAPFIDKEDDDGVFPILRSGVDEATIGETFNAFYASNVAYEIAKQWALDKGPFDLSFKWLSTRHDPADIAKWAKRHFQVAIGVDLDSIAIR